MSCGKHLLFALRVLAAVVALGIVGLGAYTKFTIHDLEVRGNSVLDTLPLSDEDKDAWQNFFMTVLSGIVRIWVTIGATSFATLTLILILSTRHPRLTISSTLLSPLELLAALSLAASFGLALSFSLNLDAAAAPIPSSNINLSPDLATWATLCLLLKILSITIGTAWFLLSVTFIAGVVEACTRSKSSKCCSFEPTASALGMGHGYQAVQPPARVLTSEGRMGAAGGLRDAIPTLYDPRKPVPGEEGYFSKDLGSRGVGRVVHADVVDDDDEEEKRMVGDVGNLGRRDSGLSASSGRSLRVRVVHEDKLDGEKEEISWPLALERPGQVQQMRPARPWSEAPKRR